MSPGVQMRPAGPNDGSFGAPFLSPEWGEWGQSIARACSVAGNDLAAEATKARVDHVHKLRALCLMAATRPATPAACLYDLDLCVGTGQVVLMMAALLIQTPPERREEWLNHVEAKAIEAVGHAAAAAGQDPDDDVEDEEESADLG